MPKLIAPYDPRVGPVVPVTIADPAAYRMDEDMPRSERITMLVDTGASDSSIAGAVADRLSLPVLGYHGVSGFGGSKPALQYLADMELWLEDVQPIPDWKVLRFDSDYDRIQGILGGIY